MSKRRIESDLDKVLNGDTDAYQRVLDYITHQRRENARLRGEATQRAGQVQPMDVTGYTRQQPWVIVEWACTICGAHHVAAMLPGAQPKYCPPAPGEKYSDCQRQARTEAVKRHRSKS